MDSGQQASSTNHDTGPPPAADFVAFSDQQRQQTRASNRPCNSNQAQPRPFHASHPRNKGYRNNRAPNQGGSNLAKDRSFLSAPYTNGDMHKASHGNGLSDRIRSQISAILKANEQSRTTQVPDDRYNESPQPMTQPEPTTKLGEGRVPVCNSLNRRRGGFHNNQKGKSANETTKAHSHNQDAKYEKTGEASKKPQTNTVSADENGLKQMSLASESKSSPALPASSLPDPPHVLNKSHPSIKDESTNHHQQINAALNPSNQQSDTYSQVEGKSALRNCNMEAKHPVPHDTPLHKSEVLRGGRLGNHKGSQREKPRWSRGSNPATESHQEALGKDSTFDPSDLDAVVNDNPYSRINIGRLPKYQYPGAKKTTGNKPLRRIANAPSHHVGRARMDSVPGTATEKSIDGSLATGNSSGVAHEAEEAASSRGTVTPADKASPAAHPQPAIQPADGGAIQNSPHRPTDGHAIEKERHCPDVHSHPHGASSCDQNPNRDRQAQGLPPHLKPGSSKKATVAVPSIFSSLNGVNKTKDQKADGLSEDTLSRKETKDKRHLGHGLENIVNPGAATAKVDEHHKSLVSMSHHAKTTPIPVNKAASNKASEPEWGDTWQDPPIGNDWNMRPQHPVEERKASTHAFAEEQAVDPEAAIPVVDMHSSDFLSGLPVLDDEGVHELNLNETRPRLKARSNGHASKSSKTAADRIKEHAVRVASVEIVQPTAMTVEEKREIRRIIIKEHRDRPSPPNLHAPVANIYLRPVETKDVRQITDLWNHFVTYSTDVPTLDPDETVFWHNEIKRVINDHEPFLVAIIKGDHSSRSFREARRLKQEHIVGFARATDYGASGTVFRYTVELEVFVKDGHMRKGIGTCLFDRMMNALSSRYNAKNGVPLICTPKEGESSWRAGQWRDVKTILINLLGQDNDEAVAWKKKWLEKEDFHQCGFVPNIGHKLDKL